MKVLWNTFAVLAIANLIGLLGFVWWLKSSGRLDSARVQKIREMLKETIPQEKARLEAEQAKAAETAKVKAADDKLKGPPETAAEAIDRQQADAEANQQTIARQKEEIRQLREALARQQADIDAGKAALTAGQKQLAAKQQELKNTVGSEQFQQALDSLEAQKPPAAKQVLQALIDKGEKDQAVTYLASMQDRSRAKVLAEFIKADGKLAADLLEQLRTRGIENSTAVRTPSK